MPLAKWVGPDEETHPVLNALLHPCSAVVPLQCAGLGARMSRNSWLNRPRLHSPRATPCAHSSKAFFAQGLSETAVCVTHSSH
jgi:hypothetical protein